MAKEYKFYGGKETIIFDNEKKRHAYFDSKGNRLISVTGATSIIDKSGALMGWTAKMIGLFLEENWERNRAYTQTEISTLIVRAKSEYRKVQKEAQDIGTDIHAWIEDWIAGKKPDMPSDERVVNGITGFLKFQEEHKYKWIESEKMVYSRKHNYVGFFDAMARKGSKRILVDFKSTNEKIDPKTGEVIEVPVYSESAFQTAGYQLAEEEETKKKIDYRMVIAFGKRTGAFGFKEFKDNDQDKEVFLNCLAIRRRLNELKG